jgi:hypothetical protein
MGKAFDKTANLNAIAESKIGLEKERWIVGSFEFKTVHSEQWLPGNYIGGLAGPSLLRPKKLLLPSQWLRPQLQISG